MTCSRQWSGGAGVAPAPQIICVENSVSLDHDFSSQADDYLAIWFTTERTHLTVDDLFLEIGPFAARPAGLVTAGKNAWHANCKLPPGLRPGPHALRMRIGDSARSNSVHIYVDTQLEDRVNLSPPTSSHAVEIAGVADGRTWESDRVRTGPGSCVSVWARGLPKNVPAADITLRLDGTDLPAVYISAADPEGLRQVNAILPGARLCRSATLSLVVNGVESAPVQIELIHTI